MTRKQNEYENLDIELRSLEDKARTAISKEAYQQLVNADDYRIGVSVILSVNDEASHIIEFLLCVLKNHAKIDVSLLKRTLEVSKILIGRGYQMLHQDDGWIICEKVIEPENIQQEYRFLESLVADFKGLRSNK